MIKKIALILAILMVAYLALSLLGLTTDMSITINGHEIQSPLDAIIGIWSLIVTTVVLFCVAILLAFVFAGVGLVVVGSFAFTGVILTAVMLPFLLPLIIPLFIVWIFCATLRKPKPTKDPS